MDYVNVRQPAFDVTATVSFAVRLQIRRYVFRTCMDYVNVRQPAFDDSSVRKSSEHRQTSQEGSVWRSFRFPVWRHFLQFRQKIVRKSSENRQKIVRRNDVWRSFRFSVWRHVRQFRQKIVRKSSEIRQKIVVNRQRLHDGRQNWLITASPSKNILNIKKKIKISL